MMPVKKEKARLVWDKIPYPNLKLKYWCMVKHPRNSSGEKWEGKCVGCCAFCDVKDCPLRTCSERTRRETLCCWRATPSEWMMAKIDERIEKKIYKLRQVEHFLKEGYKAGDGTWRGSVIKKLQEKYGKDFGRS